MEPIFPFKSFLVSSHEFKAEDINYVGVRSEARDER